ncbi:hypothetical protein CLAFUW4_01296 [Fulvia fulva]|uniref:Heterokaryon incompatibility domain-containing protein n=1 Tax=Passalora fulva TaxID=5499 RepID=A0A9Q8P4M8_PASFU|nr:uncharacterized protein CLAFUR5_01301 [Fulvia fulva]KAK4634977.1 hypothetical protein CLAFUR4_01297 [Fulvia fulva]KAK4637539.1 hypothetical protein CLAFUR0_01298 [Fulvia fulva]UJO13034.1 hypothetical protein CLAFUR5_01301 [Fulvia fulva]WPV08199.1 hypothetical protein CLAFUW4_01296 [Fulvia fulva]WPV25309.1 hypothetical protein CLAFUW7_01301 [Fulvia fulva]
MDVSPAFPYQHLEDDHIRLIQLLPQSTGTTIECSIHHSKLEEAEDNYIALSYCWGDSTTTELITLDGHPIRVTQNLWHAYTAIVQHHDRNAYYWIDALCVNQQNLAERNHHVQRMGMVYSTAKAVHTWLGSEDHETVIAFTEIVSRANANTSTGSNPPDQRAATAVGNLASREYFNRAWVIQEFIPARNLQILCGRFTCDWTALDACIKDIETYSGVEIDYTVGANNLLGGRGAHLNAEPDTATLSHWERFYGCMMIFSQAKCFDARDRVFATLDHPWLESIPGDMLRVDYSLTKEEVMLSTLETCERIRVFEREVSSAGLSEDDQEFVEAIWQQMFLTIGQAGVDHGKRELKLFRHGVLEQHGWGCSRLPLSVSTQSGREVDCSGPVLAFLLQLAEIQTT